MTRSLCWVASIWAALISAGCAAVPSPVCDIRIAGGVVIDGSGSEGRVADVWITGDRIVHVGPADDSSGVPVAKRTIDARGKVVTPGFIDPHAHGNPRRTPAFENFTSMGVTTICLGLDGSSPGRGDLTEWMQAVEKGRIGPNIASLVGHGSARRQAGIGMATNPGEAQIQRMADIVRSAMQAGAFGMSTGLEYEPGRFADPAELAAVAAPVAEHGGLVMSHMRSEDDGAIEAAIEELVTQCRTAGCRAHVSHMKIVYAHGVERTEEVLGLLDKARESGLAITADVYPYLASYTGIGIVFPEWARPPNDYDKVVAARRDELASWIRHRVTKRNGPEATIFGSGKWSGKSLATVAEELGKPFEHVLVDDIGPRGASAAYFVMASEVMERLLQDPHVMVCSDGSPTMRHPRGHGTFARVIREFVVEREILSLEAAVHKMTGLTAATVGLDRRGLLREGFAADVLVFDPDSVRDLADFQNPYQKAEGFDIVLINGELVRDSGNATSARPGRLLRRK